MRNVPKTPPMKNPITAINEPKLSNDNPVMAWPDAHPLAYLEPNPMHNPPKALISISIPKSPCKPRYGQYPFNQNRP